MNAHHIVFTPKYRANALKDEGIRQTLVSLFNRICDLRQITILEMSLQADHVHIFLDIPRTLSVSKAIQDIKWYTSLYARKRHPELTLVSQTALWQRSFFSRSIGGDATHVRRYIQNQKL